MTVLPWDDGWSLMEVCALIGIIIGAIGLLGNMLMLWVCNLADMATLSTNLFMTGLALTDSTTLIFHLLDDIGHLAPNISSADILYGNSDWRCRISNFVYDWTFMLSSWCTVGVIAELFLVQTFPQRRHLLYNNRRAMYVMSSMMLVAIAGCFPVSVITLTVSPGQCSSNYVRFYNVYHNIVIQIIINGAVPVTIIVLSLGKCAIAHAFANNKRTVTEVNVDDNTIKIQEISVEPEAPTHRIHVVVAIGIMFIISLTPYTVLTTVTVLQQHNLVDYVPSYNMDNALAICRLLLHANYALKFPMSFVLSHTFRTTFRLICNYGSTVHSKSMASLRGALSGGAHSRHTRSELYSSEGQPGVAAVKTTSSI